MEAKGGRPIRTLAKYLAAISGSLLVLIALSGGTAWLLVGTADNATSTAMSMLSQDAAGRAVGSVMIESLASEADPASKAALEEDASPLADAAAVGVRASEAAISLAIHGAYAAVEKASTIIIDLRPVFVRVAVELHRVDARIPADVRATSPAGPGDSDMRIPVDGSKLAVVRTIITIIGAWWVLLVVALVLLLLAGVCDRRAPVRRWRVTGISLATPSGLLVAASLALPLAAPGAESTDSTILLAFISVAQSTMIRLAGIVLFLAVAIIVATILVKPSDSSRAQEPADITS